MLDFLLRIFDTQDFPARWRCGDWTVAHGWLHILSDGAIFGAYAAIPLSIAYYVAKRDDIYFPKLYWLFAAFIFSCGFGHLIEATLFWQPWYRFSGAVKVLTAVVSWVTVLALVRYVPAALNAPGALRLNRQLTEEIAVRRNAEDEVRRLNQDLTRRLQELETLLEVLPVGIGIATDPACHHIRTNRALGRILRIDATTNASLSAPSGEAPTHFKVFQHDLEVAPGDLPIQAAIARNAAVHDWEADVVFNDGQRRRIMGYAAPLHDEQGSVRGGIGAFVDITAGRQAEVERRKVERRLQETQRLESLGLLAGGIAHDFNNLLTAILGNVALGRLDLPATSPALDPLEKIEKTSLRAADLCKQMLAYSGRGRFQIQKVNLSHLIDDAKYLLESSAGKDVVLRYHLAERLPAVEVDATQIRQIILNLVINASEAIGQRPGTISLTTGRQQVDRSYLNETVCGADLPEGDYVFLEVSDNGCGMSRETLAQIFDPFFTTKFTGRGLGLAAVLGIVKGHAGALRVYSEPGRGTTFKILLPVTGGPADEAPAHSRSADTWRGTGTLLVVDDEDDVRTVTARLLGSFGFEVISATDGVEAVEAFRANAGKIEVVLLDLTMPRMGGEEAFREIRRIRPDARVVLMSGFSEQEAATRFAGRGLSRFVQKPFQSGELRQVLRDLLG